MGELLLMVDAREARSPEPRQGDLPAGRAQARAAARRPSRAGAPPAAVPGAVVDPVPARPRRSWWPAERSGRERGSLTGDVGMATAEYAIATVAAAGFAGLLIAVLRSDEVRGMLLQIVRGALSL